LFVCFVGLFLNLATLGFFINIVLSGMSDILKSEEILLIYGKSNRGGKSYTPYCQEQVNGLLMKNWESFKQQHREIF